MPGGNSFQTGALQRLHRPENGNVRPGIVANK